MVLNISILNPINIKKTSKLEVDPPEILLNNLIAEMFACWLEYWLAGFLECILSGRSIELHDIFICYVTS